MIKLLPLLAILLASPHLLLAQAPTKAESIPKKLMGDWSLDLESGEPAWLSISEVDGEKQVRLRIHVGPEEPFEIDKVESGRIHFTMKGRKKKVKIESKVEVRIVDGKLDGKVVRTRLDGSDAEEVKFTGKKIPPMPKTVPDLSKVKFGKPIQLFNGKDMAGWRPHEDNKINGWSAENGMLVNKTPKTDFSATGAHANLRTVDEFEDFRIQIDFLIEAQRNSGVYLRGIYEAQVVDRDSRMQGLQGVGSIFSRIAPSKNAGKPGGEWQSYDITLVDRHVTVILNGEKVIDNQPVIGPTGGAIYTDPSAPGPIYLQGDHTAVKYKNIVLTPVVNE